MMTALVIITITLGFLCTLALFGWWLAFSVEMFTEPKQRLYGIASLITLTIFAVALLYAVVKL